MLDRQLILSEPELVAERALAKGVDAPVSAFIETYEAWKKVYAQLGDMNAESNKVSKSIGALMARGKKEEAEAAKAEAGRIKQQIPELEQEERRLEAALRELEYQFPNLPHVSVPVGKTEEDNQVVRSWGEQRNFDFEPKPHWDIAEPLGMLDFQRATKISGSGFAVYRKWGARLQRALFNFMIDRHTFHGDYQEIYPPYIVNRASLYGTGQLPKFEEDLFKVGEDHYLIPTAEVPVTNLYRDEMLELWQLPMKFAAFSGCFRKEAGAAGKDTRGIQRMHQFDKVELVKYTLPETSYDELESLVSDAESILQALGLHYRVTLLCSGEMSFSNAKCYDLEVWSPGIGRYLEVSSCSNFEAYQARRANIRFRRAQGEKPEFVHILNGSGVACPRLFSAIVETYQQADGSIEVPEALRGYVGTDVITAD
jgi:seryl-tRNA synthetase